MTTTPPAAGDDAAPADLITVPDAIELSGLSRSTIERAIRRPDGLTVYRTPARPSVRLVSRAQLVEFTTPK